MGRYDPLPAPCSVDDNGGGLFRLRDEVDDGFNDADVVDTSFSIIKPLAPRMAFYQGRLSTSLLMMMMMKVS
jgi:hypothetical protein